MGVGAPAAAARRHSGTDDSNPDPVYHDPVPSLCAAPETSLGSKDNIPVQEVSKSYPIKDLIPHRASHGGACADNGLKGRRLFPFGAAKGMFSGRVIPPDT